MFNIEQRIRQYIVQHSSPQNVAKILYLTQGTKGKKCLFVGRRVLRYQRGNQNPYIEEEQTTQWPKEKIQTTIYKTYT